ncbi:hypothetical protein CFP65_4813 [Kitasatospora sp. MMS16-BH015]|uniref:zf-HC2 domain-containing protein n=1 Tax=Kitasatospora sp. MMS16-BH015 TaxID=2018025 RepID=UPI000CA3EB6C|nr:zf-HC2 domain-containing protein [Kitasatospora sp. MMS16-BH015]AUG79534.1 hypothetical protein CFP65_4813 [Kitasatospora sp. MMS16-BH015]
MSAASPSSPSGPTGSEPSARSRRTPGWAQRGRRAEPAEPSPGLQPGAPPAATLRAIPVHLAEPASEEHHLGDRLSSFVDGELGHDSRERVQAHLATCPECLAEADEGRAVKHLLTHSGTPGPSATLMSRLLAVAALPDDEQPGDGAGGPGGPGSLAGPAGPIAAPGTLGGSRLNGGSFGRGAGASFGAGALGAHAPLPGVDPRAARPRRSAHHPEPLAARPAEHALTDLLLPGAARPEYVLAAAADPATATAVALPARSGVEAAGPGPVEREPAPHRPARRRTASPFAALLPAPLPVARPSAARGRRFVFAAAGAFSVAAVTLGGVTTVSGLAGDGQRHGATVTPVRGGTGPVVPISGEVPVDFPVYPVRASHGAGAVPQAPYSAQPEADDLLPHHLLR